MLEKVDHLIQSHKARKWLKEKIVHLPNSFTADSCILPKSNIKTTNKFRIHYEALRMKYCITLTYVSPWQYH